VPLLMPALCSAWIWIALLSFRELTMGVLIYSPASITLPLVSWSLWLSGFFNQAAAVSLLIIGCLCPLVLIYFYVSRKTAPMFYR